MKKYIFDFQRLAAILIILIAFVYLLIIGKSIITPIAFSILFGLVLKPLATFIERFVKNRIFSIIITFILVISVLLLAISLFTVQFVYVIQNLPNIADQVKNGVDTLLRYMDTTWGVTIDNSEEWIKQNFSNIIDAPLSIVQGSISTSTSFLAGAFLAFLYTAFFLFYRDSLRNFILYQFYDEQRERGAQLVKDLQQVTQKYLYGLSIVILILGVLNSLGLYFIGIGYAFFWGFLAAFMAIIPYIGTTLGGTLPFLYALATTGTMWQPAAVVALYFTVQQIEGNFITPRIVGSSVNINPFVVIVALIIGGAIWGVAGLILSLPTAALLKVVFSHLPAFEPLGILFSDNLYADREAFEQKYNEDKYRLLEFFRKKKVD